MLNTNEEEKYIHKLADDLLIGLTEEESKMLIQEFDDIKKNIDSISKIPNIENIEPMTHPYDLYEASLRDDIPTEEINIDLLLRNADVIEGREVVVPKVVGSDE